MKRKLAFLLAFVMLFCVCFTACSGEKKDSSKDEDKGDEIVQSVTTKAVIEVPRFIGKMYYAEVENVEEYDHDFNLQIVWEEAESPDVEKGKVFKQSIAADEKVVKGTTITLYVNGVVFDADDFDLDPTEIAGTHKDTVRWWLERSGFAVYESYQRSGSIPAKHVISIDIEVGKVYPYGTRVTMLVSTGA